MIEIFHKLVKPPEWYEQLHEYIPSKISGKNFYFDKEVGEGFLQYIELQNGLWAQQIQVLTYEDMVLNRIPTKTNDTFVIDFFLFHANITKEIEGKIHKLGFENVNLLLTSSNTSSKFTIQKNKQINIFNIIFTKDWLMNNVLIDHKNVRDLFATEQPIYISETLDQKLKLLLKKINFKDNKLTTFAHVIQIVDYLFQRVKEREMFQNRANYIHPNDFEQMLEIKKYIAENTDQNISLSVLSEKAGMSLSKFKKLFKQIFGTTPYQYHLANKMEKSMEVILQNKYNISEVGYLMGYSNLSQFSKAFKNHFGILPSQVNAESA